MRMEATCVENDLTIPLWENATYENDPSTFRTVITFLPDGINSPGIKLFGIIHTTAVPTGMTNRREKANTWLLTTINRTYNTSWY